MQPVSYTHLTHVDIAIIGAGPAGLCFAKSLAETGLKVMLIERQSEAAIADPAFDGREIAVTRHSAKLMQALGLWEHIDAQAISPLRDARVLNGASLFALNFSHSETKQTELGYLISNHHIRKAAYEAVKGCPAIKLHKMCIRDRCMKVIRPKILARYLKLQILGQVFHRQSANRYKSVFIELPAVAKKAAV